LTASKVIGIFEQMERQVPSFTSKPPTSETPAGLPTPDELRDKIQDFEDLLLESDGQFTPDIIQYFCSGVYMRQVFFPAGTLVTGRVHRFPCLNVLLQGEIEVVTDQGVKLLVAPLVFEAPAGVKRAARVISDTIWLTVHAHHGEERDSDTMADLLTVPSYELLESHGSRKALEKE